MKTDLEKRLLKEFIWGLIAGVCMTTLVRFILSIIG